MNEPKHTPGPCQLREDSKQFPWDPEKVVVDWKIIAAAPELLEALDCLTAVIGLTPIKGNLEALQEAYEQARAAIAKAKGEGQHHA